MQPVADRVHAVEARLAFARSEDISIDDPHLGLSRARTLHAPDRLDPRSYDWHTCRVTDCSVAGLSPDLLQHGFAHAELSDRTELQAALEHVRSAGRLGAADVAEIRRHLAGRRIALRDGRELWLLHIAREGFFMRRAGPNGMALPRDPGPGGINDHDATMSVHADQDVDGTPLRQILRGTAPWLFRHDRPAGGNRRSPLLLLNLWIPLEQATRPLALMDASSLDRRAHQLRYGLVTDGILQRDSSRRINDIWLFRHHASQRWYFTSEIDANTAYVFSTLSTPHGSIILPGEDRAEARYRALTAAVDAVRRRDEPGALRCLRGTEFDRAAGEPATAPLRRAIAAMEALLEEGRANLSALCRGEGAASWCARASAAAERVVRKSLEMRAVALLLPAPRRRS
ncbi:MAG: hypothetical protein U1A78_39315 [Polyangia bacterium]